MREDKILVCPDCGSDQVTTVHIQRFMVNTGEHYCHSIKTHDDDSPSGCLKCDWVGIRKNLSEIDDPKAKKKEAKDVCPKCSKPWEDHEFAVPAPYCP